MTAGGGAPTLGVSLASPAGKCWPRSHARALRLTRSDPTSRLHPSPRRHGTDPFEPGSPLCLQGDGERSLQPSRNAMVSVLSTRAAIRSSTAAARIDDTDRRHLLGYVQADIMGHRSASDGRTGPKRPDPGTIGNPADDRDYPMSTYDIAATSSNAPFGCICASP